MPAWLLLLVSTLAVTVIFVATVGLSWKDFMSFAREVDNVGTALGMAVPAKMDLVKSTRKSRRQGKPELPMGLLPLTASTKPPRFQHRLKNGAPLPSWAE